MSTNSNNETVQVVQNRSLALEAELHDRPERFRMLTGDRPTGALHIGHLFGTLLNRVRMQELGVEVFVLIADYQTITDRDLPDHIRARVLGLVADYLAVGLDPERATIFAHSQVTALNQLMIPFLSLVSVAEVETESDDQRGVRRQRRLDNERPLCSAIPSTKRADILFCRANVVPVGKDQLPHLEVARLHRLAVSTTAIALTAPSSPREPIALLSDAPLILGLDGFKMSKSRKNSITLAMDEDETAQLVRSAKTDSDRRITFDPIRRPEVSNLLLLVALCTGQSPEVIADEVADRGSGELKTLLSEALNERLRPMRERRREVAEDLALLSSVLARGNDRAREIADETLGQVRQLMDMSY